MDGGEAVTEIVFAKLHTTDGIMYQPLKANYCEDCGEKLVERQFKRKTFLCKSCNGKRNIARFHEKKRGVVDGREH